jgi:hypothetical protein
MSGQFHAPVILPQNKQPAVPIADEVCVWGGGGSKASLDVVTKEIDNIKKL